MKIRINDIEELLKKAVAKFISEDEATYFAKEQIEVYLRKYPRTNPLEEAVGDIEVWKKKQPAQILTIVDKASSILIDFNKLSPSLKIKYIPDQLEKKAKNTGIAMLGIKNSSGLHTLSLWTQGLSKRNLLGLCWFNGGPAAVVPYGGTEGLLGTNPISYSIPTNNDPIAADLATSEIPYFEVVEAKEKGISLRENVAVDSSGKVTTNASKALDDKGISNLLPMGGGYKGFNLVLLNEILTGSLVQSMLSTEQDLSYLPEEHGGLIIAIDISAMTDLSKFKNSVSDMSEKIRQQKSAEGFDRIRIPGEESYRKLGRELQLGEIEIAETLLERLHQI